MSRNETAIITGASKGLGLGIARSLLLSDWNVHLIARNEFALLHTQLELQDEFPNQHISIQQGDMTLSTSVEQCVEFIQQNGFFVRALVLNHGGPNAGKLLDFTDAEWENAYQLLIGSVVRWCRAFVPTLTKTGHGRILLLGSSTMREPIAGLALSNVMRSGLVGFIKTAAREWASLGITINGLAPGSFETERIEHLLSVRAVNNSTTVDIEREQALKKIPVGRFGQPIELGHLASFLTSIEASYITGQTILCDGGATIGLP